jgi:P pilus assembly chaperone PapD
MKNLPKFLLTVALSSLFAGILSPFCFASGQINVTPLSIDFTTDGDKFSDISVMNVSQDMAYVRVDISRIDHPGMPNQKIVPMDNNPQVFGLIASPTRLAIPAQQLRRIRVLPLIHNNTEDVYYQINITPVSGELESLLSPQKAIQAGVQIIVGYQVKVFIRPQGAKAVVSINRLANQVTVQNTGNSNVLLNNGQQCDAAHKNCTPLPNPAYRLFPGATWTFTLANSAPVEFTESFLKQTQTLKSN